jgi:hypothetical protein
MSWSTTTVWNSLRAKARLVACALAAVYMGPLSVAQQITVPSSLTAGTGSTISTSGSGSGTFYLVGPGVARKNQINLGQTVRLSSDDLQFAGQYLAIVCAAECHSSEFIVTAGKPATLAFLVHPSRVPVGQPDSVSGVALLFDRFDNLVLDPTKIDFQVSGLKQTLYSRGEVTHDGEVWFRTNSGKEAGPVHLTASAGDLTAKRVVQQVASDPCNLRIRAQQTPRGIEIETEPVRDCAGNPVSDGTIVTFTGMDSAGKISIDAPIKGDIARAHMNVPAPVTISAACGVAMGNELRIGQKP